MKKLINSVFISVFYKTNGLDLVVKKFHELGIPISSTGGTADFIKGLGVPVIKAETITGYPSILGGRVKTLHPKILGGILARRGNASDIEELNRYEIPMFDLVIVDLYPFEQTIASGASHDEIVEKIDIGGISLIRAAAKNYNDVTIIASMEQYPALLNILQTQGNEISEEQRYDFAAKAFLTATVYDLAIAMYFGQGDCYGVIGEKVRDLRYGENPQQKALGLFKILGQDDSFGLDKIQWLTGNPGFINLTDFDGALQTLTHISAAYHKNDLWKDMGYMENMEFPYLAIGVKHGNACGAAISITSPEDCLMKMIDGNLTSIFGASVVTNFTITKELADMLIHYHAGEMRRPLDVIVVPAINDDALGILQRKNEKCKIGILPVLAKLDADCLDHSILIRKVRGNIIPQNNYDFVLDFDSPDISKLGTSYISLPDKIDIVLAWAVCTTSTSNTIVLVKDQMLIGAGVGQKDRKECCDLAIRIAEEANHLIMGAIACSDSFFPFPDGPQKLIDAGVKMIFTPSGSIRDKETIQLCEEKQISLLMIPNDLARMFYRH